jgi:probable rRNA maturation factor
MMRRLNARYRGIDRPTDVLSFPMREGRTADEQALLGDIVICVPKAAAQAKEYHVRFYDELLRLLIHGLLHLLGYDHEIDASHRKRMERRERELLNALKTMD